MNILLLFIIFLSFYITNFKVLYLLAFLLGLIGDLVLGNTVGYSSLIFLLVSFLVYLYRKKFKTTHIAFQVVFVVLVDAILIFIENDTWKVEKIPILIITTLIVYFLATKIKKQTASLELEI
ncbi:rod shape-determining protein MreD [Patescibacteria group bacterium]